jgi:hypothetical protein
MWVADVGQNAHEEVDTPIRNGGNYGWRVYEGSSCTGNDPLLCTASNYTPPIFDYAHTGGRCSITGGYVYRGTRGTLPLGTYVYGDFCSGEIFAWDGTTQHLLLDTTMAISSFGEDELGELYVVDLAGTVSKIESNQSCSYALSATSRTVDSVGGPGAIAVAATAGCAWAAAPKASWLHLRSGASGAGAGTVGFSVDQNATGADRTGTINIAGLTLTITQRHGPTGSFPGS